MNINFGFNDMMESVEYYIEIWTGDHKQSGNQSHPKIIAIQQLTGMAQQILQDSAPRKMYVSHEYWENDMKLKNEKIITNKAWENAHGQND